MTPPPRPRPPLPRGWHEAVGLGAAHRAERTRQIRVLRPGTPCPRCGIGMYPTIAAARKAGLPPFLRALDLGDNPPRIIARALGVQPAKRLEHAHCNRAAGPAAKQAARALGIPPRQPRQRSGSPPATRARRRARWA